ncbi:MAG: hypothetical protein AB8B95_16060 [Pseudohongiellaceae bacterium]
MAGKNDAEPKVDLAQVGNSDDPIESRTIESRLKIRDKVEEDIARFLSQGGSINEIAPDVTADPPRKPESNYGARAI